MSDPEFYRIIEVAEIMKVSRATAYALVRSGEIPTVRFGATVRVPRTALERVVEVKLDAVGQPHGVRDHRPR